MSEEESRKYIDSVVRFMAEDLDGKDVLEVGGGIGRLTARMVQRACAVTCIDASPQMLERNRERLGKLVNKVEFHEMFGQDYVPGRQHDVVVCSLVLIHNVVDEEFVRLTEVMAQCADTIFLFEHVDVAVQVSAHTRPRTEDELCRAFKDYEVAKRHDYKLFTDRIVFLKLVRKGKH